MESIQVQIDEYLQNMLKMQFHVSDRIVHKPTKGQLREKFIHNTVLNQFPQIIVKSGILYLENWQSTQGDFLWLEDNSRIGDLSLYNLNDCKMFMEIKSCATAEELRAIENTGVALKEKCSRDIYVGIFCYSTTAKETTILKKFGFTYDRELQCYNSYQTGLDLMPHVDFIYCLNITEDDNSQPYFVIKDLSGIRILYRNNPVIQYFFNFFRC